jgi:signal transduction histidine kinase
MRRRLAWLSFAVASLVVVAFLFPVAILIRNQAQNRALSGAERDVGALAAAMAVAGSVDSNGTISSEFADAVLIAFGTPAGLTIIFPDGSIVGTPVEVSVSIEQARLGAAFTARTDGGAEVLVPVLLPDAPVSEGAVVVRTFVSDEELSRGVNVAWLMLAGLGLFIIVVAVFAADRLGRSVVQPVTDLSDAVTRWGEGDLDARVVPGGPEEIVEVGEAFNVLAGRLDALLEAERESVADLSHRLRTPLTALRLQAEMVSDEDERAMLKADIDEVEHAVNVMIEEARSRPAEMTDPEPVDLGEVVTHRAEFWQVLADEQGRPTSIAIDDGAHPVPLSRAELGALIDVLVENVFAHSPIGAGYRIAVRRVPGGGSMLTLVDDGPGFADLSFKQRGESGAGSTGLGLDIVARTAQRTGGGMAVGTSRDGGAEISVRFGLDGQDGRVEKVAQLT